MRAIVIGIGVLVLAGIGLLFINQEKGAQLSISDSEITQGAISNGNTGENEARIDTLEKQIQSIDDKLSDLVRFLEQQSIEQASTSNPMEEDLRSNISEEDLASDSRETQEEDEITNLDANGTEEIDPLSPEGIKLADETQNRYINQVDKIYYAEEIDPEWAQSMEVVVLPKLADIESFSATYGSNLLGEGEDTGYGMADISVSSFECRSRLCSTEIITGSMKEMLAYQNYMVKQTKKELPSIVFSTIEPYGSKFKMKAILAKDDYEFPTPN